ncbi:MAG: hypothetical protein J0652_01385, partial [Desulfobulbaceae bacterium]|nr:hypothetical protein [Desulfobulbaceae bacterium]
ELLQHDIIREMSIAGLLETLTFIGGTCLRACYGSSPDERDKCLSQIIFLKKTRKLSVRH